MGTGPSGSLYDLTNNLIEDTYQRVAQIIPVATSTSESRVLTPELYDGFGNLIQGLKFQEAFERDGNGDLQPTIGPFHDPKWEEDENGDKLPRDLKWDYDEDYNLIPIYTTTTKIASHALTADVATTASYSIITEVTSSTVASTASYILGSNVDGNIPGNASNITSYTINQNLGTSNQVTFGGITASLEGTASWAENVISASYATTSSYASTAQTLLGVATSASYASTASYVITSNTASYVLGTNVDGNITGNAANITSYTINQNLGTTNQVTFGGVTASLQGTSSWAENVTSASYAVTSSYALTAQTLLGSVVSASYALTSSYSTTSTTSTTANTASYINGSFIKNNQVAGASFSGNPKIATVTFSTPFPDNNYSVTITGEDSRTWSIQSKVSGSFIINSNSNTTLTGNVFWQAINFGEHNY